MIRIFCRFVEGQQLWDRAMAQAMHVGGGAAGTSSVVGIMGRDISNMDTVFPIN